MIADEEDGPAFFPLDIAGIPATLGDQIKPAFRPRRNGMRVCFPGLRIKGMRQVIAKCLEGQFAVVQFA
jgi:hypothetical protein